MSHITENDFKSLLLKQLHNYSLIDRSLLSIIYSFNNFNNNIYKGLFVACQGNSFGLTQILYDKGAPSLNWGLQGACQGHNTLGNIKSNKKILILDIKKHTCNNIVLLYINK